MHKSKINLEYRMENLAGLDGLKSLLQSARLKVLPKLHKLALLRQMALIIPTLQAVIVLFFSMKHKVDL